jgi:superoxide dismutase, Cu-Zn family
MRWPTRITNKEAVMMKAIAVAMAGALVAGCGVMSGMHGGHSDSARAVATLEPTKGNSTAGTVSFTQRGNKVAVNARVTGLKPNIEHGFHVHEKGDCSSGDGMSTGGHFNPGGKAHGHGGTAPEHHAGDMPNLKADQNGNATANFELTTISVGSGAADIVGKGLIVHRDPDDYKTQPTGNAGPRLACAVIKRS